MEKRKVLGRGLETLLPSTRQVTGVAPAVAPAQISGEHVRQIPVDQFDRNPYQTRSRVDDAALEELAASIKATGVLQPITVRPVPSGRFQIIAGERRWLASQRAGKATVPAIVRHVSNEQAMEMTIIENLQREDLNPLEQARAFERLIREFGLTQEQISQRTGKERSSVANYLRLLKLPPLVQELIDKNQLTMGHAKAIMSLDSPEAIARMAQRVAATAMSVRQTEEAVTKLIHPPPRIGISPKEVDPNVADAAQRLMRSLGVQVLIEDRKGKGKIIISYESLEDFDRILEALARQ
jgi:ParB family chromosome partitioning protein